MHGQYFVYILAYKEEGPVKIGSTYDIRKRIKVIQTGSPEKLYPVLIRDFKEKRIARFAEKRIQKHLAKKYGVDMSGGSEWFDINTSWAHHELNIFPCYECDEDEYEKGYVGNYVADLKDDEKFSEICEHMLYLFDEFDEDYAMGDPESPYNYVDWEEIFPTYTKI